MNLIKKVEINYFRSLYEVVLEDTNDLNIIFGRNDSGKSNILRALNLFFNNETNPGLPFDFERDFSYHRKSETEKKPNKWKQVYVSVTFNTPQGYINSLGKNFRLSKTWLRYGGLEPALKHRKAPANAVSRFLNSIKFHYVPAIKDRKIFEHLLGEMHAVLASDIKFNENLKFFTKEIQTRTEKLTESLRNNLQIHSQLAAPSDLTNLFKSLDFDTGYKGSKLSLTLQRGDGIQVRHIPEILGFIADAKDKERHIWGFEEPENSLEIASAFDEAEKFVERSKSKNIQIFVTSHSPAFFTRSEKEIRRYHVKKKASDDDSLVDVYSKSEILSLSEMEQGSESGLDLMDELPYLAKMSDVLKEDVERLNQQMEILDGLSKKKYKQENILWVEGETDKIILEKAWEVFRPTEKRPFEVVACGGTPPFYKASKDFLDKVWEKKMLFVLVDNDEDGRNSIPKELENAKKGGRWFPRRDSRNGNWNIFWCCLKLTAEYLEWAKKYEINPKKHTYFPIEYSFSADLRHQALKEGAYGHEGLPKCFIDPTDVSFSNRMSDLKTTLGENESDKFYLLAPYGGKKFDFAKWVTRKENATVENFDALKVIIEGLAENINPMSTPE